MLSFSVCAEWTYTATGVVTGIQPEAENCFGSTNDGCVKFWIDSSTVQASCSNKYIMRTSDLGGNNLLSILMLSFSTGNPVELFRISCQAHDGSNWVYIRAAKIKK